MIQGVDLPGLDSSGLSDPYVVISLQPQVIIGSRSQKTKVMEQTLQPVYNQLFTFTNIPQDLVVQPGVCLLFTVMDRDLVKSDDFAGEVVISFTQVIRVKYCIRRYGLTTEWWE